MVKKAGGHLRFFIMEERYFCNTPSALHAGRRRLPAARPPPPRRPSHRGSPAFPLTAAAALPRHLCFLPQRRPRGRAQRAAPRERAAPHSAPARPPRPNKTKGLPQEPARSRRARGAGAAPRTAQAVSATAPDSGDTGAGLGSGCDESGVRRGHGPRAPARVRTPPSAGRHGPDPHPERHPDRPAKSGNRRSPAGGRSHRACSAKPRGRDATAAPSKISAQRPPHSTAGGPCPPTTGDSSVFIYSYSTQQNKSTAMRTGHHINIKCDYFPPTPPA